MPEMASSNEKTAKRRLPAALSHIALAMFFTPILGITLFFIYGTTFYRLHQVGFPYRGEYITLPAGYFKYRVIGAGYYLIALLIVFLLHKKTKLRNCN
jgi:hypothetical protein